LKKSNSIANLQRRSRLVRASETSIKGKNATTNYWQERVKLLVDEKKKSMVELRDLRAKLAKLQEKNA
jgi:hypothetical protein